MHGNNYKVVVIPRLSLFHVSHSTKTGKQKILTKGDNNPYDDRGLYNRGQQWIEKSDIMGKVVG